jgi:hypothetical protein
VRASNPEDSANPLSKLLFLWVGALLRCVVAPLFVRVCARRSLSVAQSMCCGRRKGYNASRTKGGLDEVRAPVRGNQLIAATMSNRRRDCSLLENRKTCGLWLCRT